LRGPRHTNFQFGKIQQKHTQTRWIIRLVDYRFFFSIW
jgi:hypothetical protein